MAHTSLSFEAGLGDNPSSVRLEFGSEAMIKVREMGEGTVDLIMLRVPPYAILRDGGDNGEWLDYDGVPLGREATVERYRARVCALFDDLMRVLSRYGCLIVRLEDSTHDGNDTYLPTAIGDMEGRPRGKLYGNPEYFANYLCQKYCKYSRLPHLISNGKPSLSNRLVPDMADYLVVAHTPRPHWVRDTTPTVSKHGSGNTEEVRLLEPQRGSTGSHGVVWDHKPERAVRLGDVIKTLLQEWLGNFDEEVRQIIQGAPTIAHIVREGLSVPVLASGPNSSLKTTERETSPPKWLYQNIIRCATSEYGYCPRCRAPFILTKSGSLRANHRCGPVTPAKPVVMGVRLIGGDEGKFAVEAGCDFIGIGMKADDALGARANIENCRAKIGMVIERIEHNDDEGVPLNPDPGSTLGLFT